MIYEQCILPPQINQEISDLMMSIFEGSVINNETFRRIKGATNDHLARNYPALSARVLAVGQDATNQGAVYITIGSLVKSAADVDLRVWASLHQLLNGFTSGGPNLVHQYLPLYYATEETLPAVQKWLTDNGLTTIEPCVGFTESGARCLYFVETK